MKNTSFRDAPTRDYFHSLFARQGVNKNRITLLPGVASLEKHLALYSSVDIALDTFPYNGTTTSCEALWMGVPVVTLSGATHASRVGSSLLSQIGMPCYVADSIDSYVLIATRLASDKVELSRLHCKLRDEVRTSPLCDAAGKTRHIEAFYRKVWKSRCAPPGKKRRAK